MAQKELHQPSSQNHFKGRDFRVSALWQPIHPSWCFYAGVCGVIGGIIFGLVFKQMIFCAIIWLFIALALLLFSFFRAMPLTLPLAFFAGFIIAGLRLAPVLTDQINFAKYYGKQVVISGTIIEDPKTDDGNTAIKLESLRLYSPRDGPEDVDLVAEFSGTLYVKLSSAPELYREDVITINGKLNEGFGTFIGSMYRPELTTIDRSSLNPLLEFKKSFSNQVRETIASPAVDLGLGYLMGDKNGLSSEFTETLRLVGMTHVVVASGAHLAILIGNVKKLFGKISKLAGTVTAVAMVLAFATVVGFTPSMTRAALVAIFGLVFGYFGRKFTPLRLIFFTAAITLIISPTNFLNLGWQLSFSSFFGIMIVAPRLTKTLYGGKRPPWLASMFITSFSTSLVCAPILISNFGELSLLSFVANLVILPTLPYAMLLVLLTGVLSFCAPLAGFFGFLATLLLNLHIWVIEFLSQQTMFILRLGG